MPERAGSAHPTGSTGKTSSKVLSATFGLAAVASTLLVIVAVTGFGGHLLLAGLLFVFVSAVGLIFPNVTALTMAPFAANAGSASALMGALRFGMGAGAATLVSLLHNGTAIPSTALVAVCGIGGYLLLRLFPTGANEKSESPRPLVTCTCDGR